MNKPRWCGPRRALPVHRVHGGPRRAAAGCARRGSARPRRRAMAGSGELAAAALRGTGSDGEGAGVLAPARRARCAPLRGQEAAVEAGARRGAAQRRRHNYGEGAHATERERANGKGTGRFLTSTRSSGGGPRCRRRCGSGDRRRRLELHGAAKAAALLGF